MKKYLGMALVGAIAAFGVGCSDSGGGGTAGTGGGGTGGTGGGTGGTGGGMVADPCGDQGGSGDVEITTDEINEDTLWAAGCDYFLTEITYVVDSKLTIEAGVSVKGDQGSALIISRGSEIDAQGTVDDPIVMTSSRAVGARARGDWGGLAILGEAVINRGLGTCGPGTATPVCEDSIEGLETSETRGRFGGDDNASSCGSITYTRIEFAGREVIPGNELNGLTVAGCGSGTTLDYIQVHRGLDDGVEFFGGTANISHVIMDGMGDDGLDWDQGYQGTVMNFIVHHYDGRTDDPRGIEADNFGQITTITPRSAPTVMYGTIVADDGAEHDQGVVLRRGTWGTLDGLVVEGYNTSAGIDVRDDGWDGADGGWPNELVVRGSCFDGNDPNYPTDVDCGGANEEDCNDESTENAGTFFPEDTNLSEASLGNLEEDPEVGDYSGAATGGTPDYSVGNANCMGAFATTGADNGTDWTADWTAFPVN